MRTPARNRACQICEFKVPIVKPTLKVYHDINCIVRVNSDVELKSVIVILIGQYYMKNILPKTNYLAKKILSGDKIIMSLNTEQF